MSSKSKKPVSEKKIGSRQKENVAQFGMSASDWIRDQPVDMPPKRLMGLAKEKGLSFSMSLIPVVRGKMPGYKGRKRGAGRKRTVKAVAKGVDLQLSKPALGAALLHVNTDKLVREAGKYVMKLLRGSRVVKFGVNVETGTVDIVQFDTKTVRL